MNGHPVVFDLVGLESPVMDFVVRVDHLPQSDERQRVLESLWQGGGKIIHRSGCSRPSGRCMRHSGRGRRRLVRRSGST